jgi:hypothetical protein
MMIFAGVMMLITLVSYIIPLRSLALMIYITIIGGVVGHKLSKN